VSRDGGPDRPCRGPRPDRLPRHLRESHGQAQAADGPDPTWVLAHTRSRTLRDGTAVVLRPILPQDKPYLVSILRRMSAGSRRLRFHHAKARLTRRELRYLTEIDYEDHFAWCAFIVDDNGTSAIGVARYVRVAPMSDHAEVAIEIVDQYQSRGLGTTLIGLLAQTALQHGITSFIAYVEPDNASVIRWAQKAGGSFVGESGVLRLELSFLKARSMGPSVGQELVRSA
jgi:RimJ/RimL family protein N-acetyltransferase